MFVSVVLILAAQLCLVEENPSFRPAILNTGLESGVRGDWASDFPHPTCSPHSVRGYGLELSQFSIMAA